MPTLPEILTEPSVVLATETRVVDCDCDGGLIYRAGVTSRWALGPAEVAERCTGCDGKAEYEVEIGPVTEEEIMEATCGAD